MAAWLEFAGVVAFITLIGWLMWNDIASWYDQDVCTCRKGSRCLRCIERDGLTNARRAMREAVSPDKEKGSSVA